MNELQRIESENPLISVKEIKQKDERIFKILVAAALKSGFVLSGFPLPDEDSLQIIMKEFIEDLEGSYWLPIKSVRSAIKKGVSGEYGEDRTRISSKNWRHWISQERELSRHELSRSEMYHGKKEQFLTESRKVFHEFKNNYRKEMNQKIMNLNGSNLDISQRQRIFRKFKSGLQGEFWSGYKQKVDELAVEFGIMNEEVQVVKSGEVFNQIFGIK